MILDDGNADFIFGLTGNAVLARRAEGLMKNARGHLALHQSMHAQKRGPAVQAMRLFGEFEYAAKSWSQAHRVVLKAEVLAGSNGAPTKQPPAKAGGFEIRTESPDTHRLNDAS